MSKLPDDLLEPEDAPEEPAETPDDEDDEPRWSGEESLGLLPPD
ncbi:MAG: hypothetical protein ACRDNH_03640 [Gaiellaceae bacterium]